MGIIVRFLDITFELVAVEPVPNFLPLDIVFVIVAQVVCWAAGMCAQLPTQIGLCQIFVLLNSYFVLFFCYFNRYYGRCMGCFMILFLCYSCL